MKTANYPALPWPWVGLLLCLALRKVFEGSGECAKKGWGFLHLSIAGWTLVFFIAMTAASFALIRRDR
jgi:disulfide bond formation protein DsbB